MGKTDIRQRMRVIMYLFFFICFLITEFISIEEPTLEHQTDHVKNEERKEKLHFLFFYLDSINQEYHERKEHLDGFGSQIHQLHFLRCISPTKLEYRYIEPSENVEEHRNERIPFKIVLRHPNGNGRAYTPSGYQHQQGEPSDEKFFCW
jgi:hypothetical protein